MWIEGIIVYLWRKEYVVSQNERDRASESTKLDVEGAAGHQ